MTARKLSFKTPQGEAEFVDAYQATLALWPISPESFYVETEYGDTHILACGKPGNEPLVLFHGFGFGATMWFPNIEVLSRDHRVYCVDVMGDFNKSVMKKHFHTKTDCANWVGQVLDELGLDSAILGGHSAGGWQAINFATHHPERVKKLMLLAPAASFVPFRKEFFLRMGMAVFNRKRSYIVDSFGKWFVAKGNKIPDEPFEQFFRGIANFKFQHKIQIPSVFIADQLKRIVCPVLLLIGDKEVIYKTDKAINLAKATLAHVQTQVVPNASHALNIEQAEFVNQHMLDFLSKPTGNP